MRGLVALGALGLLASIAACPSPRSAYDLGFASCTDPAIVREPPPRILVQRGTPPLIDRLKDPNPRSITAEDARVTLAGAQIAQGNVHLEPHSGETDAGDAVGQFIESTDFTRDDLVFAEDSFNGDEGMIGQVREAKRIRLVVHRCSSSGGADPGHTDWVNVYRVPKAVAIVRVDCGECAHVACCPP